MTLLTNSTYKLKICWSVFYVLFLCIGCTSVNRENTSSDIPKIKVCNFELDSFRADIFERCPTEGYLLCARKCAAAVIPCQSDFIKSKLMSLQGYFYYKAGDNDGKWFFVDSQYQADLKIYFVSSQYKAGWEESSKKHLLY